MAVFRKRGDSWQYRILYYDETGKRRERTKSGFDTKRAAQMAAGKEEAKLLNNTFIQNQNVYFGPFAEEWLEVFKRPHIKESTYDRLYRTLKNHIIPHFGELKLTDINRVMYQKWVNTKLEKYSFNTVRSYHAAMSGIFDHAMLDMNLVDRNPTHRVKLTKRNDSPDDEERVLNFLEMDELNQLLFELETRPHRNFPLSIQYFVLFSLLARTGLRIGEALALEWDDIDLDQSTLRVNKTLSYITNSNIKVTRPKTQKANRRIKLDNYTLKLLKNHITNRKEVHLAYPNYKYPETPLVFYSEFGTWLKVNVVRAFLKKTCERCGLRLISPHVLRHTHAVHLLEAGADIKYVSDRLGHTDTKMTLNIYLHVSKKIENDGIDLYEKHLESFRENQKPKAIYSE